MEGATHFIEVWKATTDTYITERVKEIERLSICLHATITSNGKTIAVWKVKLKK